MDAELARLLLKSEKPLTLAINKIDDLCQKDLDPRFSTRHHQYGRRVGRARFSDC